MTMDEFIWELQADPELCTRIEACETPEEISEIAKEYDVDQDELREALNNLAE